MGGIGDLIRGKYNKRIDCHGTIITLPENFTWVLFRHGDKTNNSPTRGGELTPLGRKQVWDTTWQLIEKFGQDVMNKAFFFTSPVYRVLQSSNIFFSAIGRPTGIEYIDELEWGPNDGHSNDSFIINELIAHTDVGDSEIVVMMGHNGLFENIAQIIHPRPGRYTLNPGEAFIIKPNDLESIVPQVTA